MLTHHGKEIRIQYFPFPEELQGKLIALTTAKNPERWIVCIDSTRHPLSQRYALGHELAHIFLDHFDRPEAADHVSEIEREADKKTWEFYRAYKAGSLTD